MLNICYILEVSNEHHNIDFAYFSSVNMLNLFDTWYFALQKVKEKNHAIGINEGDLRE